MLNRLFKLILATYPFLTKTEEETFKKKAGELISMVNKDNITFSQLEKLLSLLHNRHADIKEVNYNPEKSLETLRPTYRINNQSLYIEIPSWTKALKGIDKKLIDICVKNQSNYERIILDLRNNRGGNSSIAHKFASIFFNKDVVYGKIVRRKKGGVKEWLPMILEHNKNIYVDKKIIILISVKCFSSTELFIAPFKVTKRAVLIGEKTGGGSGNPISREIFLNNKKYKFRIPTWRFFLKGELKPLEQTAIKPDVRYIGDMENITKFYPRLKT